MEIIVKYPTGTYSTGATKGIDVIHDINRTTNIYDFTSQYFFSIQAIRNYDGISGNEVCSYWERYPSYGYKLITDRTRSFQDRANCN
ncbi:MAG: hypothetical protein HY886_06410 [Deltaproteobacteria bacterium]|nr:hypothetical protein [Deltaproteobacteria bacterium]